MSFVISSSQRLASMDNSIKLHEIRFDVEGLEITHHNVGFGQPLYPLLSDITSYRCSSEDECTIPILPSCGISFVFIKSGEESESYICGPTHELKKIDVNKDDIVIVGRFLPGTATALIKCFVGDIVDTSKLAIEAIHGGNRMSACFSKELKIDEQIRLISTIMRTYILQTHRNELVGYCISRIYEKDGNIKIDKLAEETHVTSRNINKLFDKYVGMSPKYCAEIVRVNSAVEKILTNHELRLTAIAAECGYFDHAHMNKVFKRMLHCSSGEFRSKGFDKIKYEEIEQLIY